MNRIANEQNSKESPNTNVSSATLEKPWTLQVYSEQFLKYHAVELTKGSMLFKGES